MTPRDHPKRVPPGSSGSRIAPVCAPVVARHESNIGAISATTYNHRFSIGGSILSQSALATNISTSRP
jgi:hypothetical protein